MTDPRDEYYFKHVPEIEVDNPTIDWKVYNSILNVVITFSTIDAKISRFLTEWDLFPSAFNLLAILHRTNGEGMHLSRISELLAVSRANVTGLVDVLARKDLVSRISSPADRRVRLATLTPKGAELINDILPRYYEFNKVLCSDFSDDDARTMIEKLTQLRQSIVANCGCGEAAGE